VALNQHKVTNQKKDFSIKSEKFQQLREQSSSLFCGVTQCGLVINDVSGQYIGPETSLITDLCCVTTQKNSDLFRKRGGNLKSQIRD
jgi:hypothetical protein